MKVLCTALYEAISNVSFYYQNEVYRGRNIAWNMIDNVREAMKVRKKYVRIFRNLCTLHNLTREGGKYHRPFYCYN